MARLHRPPPAPRTLLGLLALGAVLLLALSASPALAQPRDPVGTVAAITGTVLATSRGAGETRRLTEDAPVFQGDRIETAADSRVRLAFRDDTVVSLGESSAFTVDWYLHAPTIDLRSVFLVVPRGILRIVVQRLIPDSAFELRTNTAVASVRATDWMVEASADSTAVFVLEGRVAVGNRLGSVLLADGEGTDVAAGEPPTPPVRWGEARIERFLEATEVP